MTFPTHLIAGLIIGKVIGNYPLAIASSILVDIDHVQSYVKSGVIFKPKLFWKAITDRADPYGDQRGYLHNFFVFIVVSVILFLILGYLVIPLIVGWFGHILLDILDNSDYWPLYPYKKLNLKGPVLYASYREVVFALFLIVMYFLI